MKIFVFAMRKEANKLLEEVNVTKEYRNGYTSILECEYRHVSFVIAFSGVGKGFACASIAALANLYPCDYVINFGVAGTMNDQIAPIGSAVIGKDYVEDDVDTSVVGDPVGLISGINKILLPSDLTVRKILKNACTKVSIPCVEGRIASGDVFLPSNDPRKIAISNMWKPLCIDMESAPFAQGCYVYNIPYASIRLISDAHHPETEYEENIPMCVDKIKQIALQVLLS